MWTISDLRGTGLVGMQCWHAGATIFTEIFEEKSHKVLKDNQAAMNQVKQYSHYTHKSFMMCMRFLQCFRIKNRLGFRKITILTTSSTILFLL